MKNYTLKAVFLVCSNPKNYSVKNHLEHDERK